MKSLLLQTVDGMPTATGGADSAVLRPGEPVFVAEPLSQWRSVVAPAIRISRLGMSIKPAFARQYYSEYAAVHLLLPVAPGPVPPLFRDRAIAPGKWTELTPSAADTLTATLDDIDGAVLRSVTEPLGVTADEADSAVCLVSRYMTLKTGDMLIFADHAIDLGEPVLDSRLTVWISQHKSLEIKFK